MTKYNEENEDDMSTIEGQLAALWTRVNFILNRLMEEGVLGKRGE